MTGKLHDYIETKSFIVFYNFSRDNKKPFNYKVHRSPYFSCKTNLMKAYKILKQKYDVAYLNTCNFYNDN